MNLNLRKAVTEDCEDLFIWRNDPLMREMAHNTGPVSRQIHDQWFAASLAAKDRLILIGLNDKDHKIGVVRYDFLNPETAFIALNIAPDSRGLGYGTVLLKKSEDFLPAGIQTLRAEIKSINQASIKTFEQAGYVFAEDIIGVKTYLKKLSYSA